MQETKNQYRLTKLDNRHKGVYVFSHSVDFWRTASGVYVTREVRFADFNERRIWLWENFGPSEELDYCSKGASWSWWRDDDHLSLYMTDQTLTAYLMLWV